MRRLFAALLVLLAAVAVAVYARHDPGYVLIQFRGWTLEASLVLALAALALAFALLYLALRALVTGYRLPASIRDWRRRRNERLALGALERGFVDLLEGRWARAEKRLAGAAAVRADGTLLHYLGAARAAQEQGAGERRDRYLRQAAGGLPSAELGLVLAQVEMQLGKAQFAQAAASLDRLRGMAPHNPLVLVQRMRLYLQLGDWERLLELMPELRRRHLLEEAQAEGIELRAAAGLIDDPALDDESQLNAAWARLPAALKGREELLRRYVRRLLDCGAVGRAEAVLCDALGQRWDPALVYLYGLLEGGDAERQLRHAEAWLRRHPGDPVLLLSLGRLCRRKALWGKARDYLDACVKAGGTGEASNELAAVLEEMGEREAALEWYRRANEALAAEARRRAWRDTGRLPRPAGDAATVRGTTLAGPPPV